ncbi:hypothetical protein CEUSTIGMA_g215.t1 [Chlamydomonas eustigma]|uniref:Uncharacterized protein n=1 Tax=Chlamydomonas eustigma TaxID=1157962 RepID=A0A250WPY5_9CHLO|nr:hypothetical protein CEUSTIGMA_g215.t1 [Chlamydomonas eustigma]|eukprot:GAX72759.1 hypothetical protein CEUSTIGMA_g215.t1 [Chlamydomonas eustigma]
MNKKEGSRGIASEDVSDSKQESSFPSRTNILQASHAISESHHADEQQPTSSSWNLIATNPLAHAHALVTIASEPVDVNVAAQQRPLPSYMRVERFREGLSHSDYEEVVIEPVIRHLDVNDAELQARIQVEINNLYEFFRGLYDQDQKEISGLQAQLHSKQLEIKRLRGGKLVNEATSQLGRGNDTDVENPDQHKIKSSKADGTLPSSDRKEVEQGPAAQYSHPTAILFLPPHVATRPTYFKWATWLWSRFRRNQLLWLIILLAFLAILAIGLLAGLLAPRHSGSPGPSFVASGYLTLNGSSGSTFVSFQALSPVSEGLYYVVIPNSTLTQRKLLQALDLATISSADVINLVHGVSRGPLAALAAACGVRFLTSSQPYTLTVDSVPIASSLECRQLVTDAASVNSANRCLACPELHPLVPYVVLATTPSSSDHTKIVTFTTAQNSLLPPPPPPPPPPVAPPQPAPPSPHPPPQFPPMTPSPYPSPPLAISPPATPSLRNPPAFPPPTAPLFKSSPIVTASSEASVDITFQTNAPGTILYAITYPQVFARAGNVYSTFEGTAPADLPLVGSNPPWAGGVIASGSITVTQPGVNYTCRIGLDDGSFPCGLCGPENSCVLPAPCWDTLCSVSEQALSPNTTYLVYLSTLSSDGIFNSGPPIALSPVTTDLSSIPPQLSNLTKVDSQIGPYSFAVDHVQQDKQGFIYLLVTMPFNQTTQLASQSATPFIPVRSSTITATKRHLLHKLGNHNASEVAHRLLAQTSASSTPGLTHFGFTPFLPPQPAGASSAAWEPPSVAELSCDSAWVVSNFLDTSSEALVYQDCLSVVNISEYGQYSVTQLQNNTLYNVKVITSDIFYNNILYLAEVVTVDLTPPVFVKIIQSAGFTNFTLVPELDKAGYIYAFVLTQQQASNTTLTVGWPPAVMGPYVAYQYCEALTAPYQCQLTFLDGLTSNTNYLVYLLAKDTTANIQQNFTVLLLHTDDNNPPQWLDYGVIASGFSANFSVLLNKPCIVSYQYGLTSELSSCPVVEQIYSEAPPPGTHGVTVGKPFLFSSLSRVTTTINKLQDASNYTLCIAAQDTTTFKNKQLVPLQLFFSTPDVTPPVLHVIIVAGTDGNVTCDRLSSYTCGFEFLTGLNKPGSAGFVLYEGNSTSLLLDRSSIITSQEILAQNPVHLMLNGSIIPYTYGNFSLPKAYVSHNTTIMNLPDNSSFVLLVAAQDTFGNINQTVQQFTFTTPDVTPPVFLADSGISLNDSSIAISATLNKSSCTISYVVVPSPSTTPSVIEVFALQAAQGAVPTSTGTFLAPTANISATANATGLTGGMYYDIYLVAVDGLGNKQNAVTSILAVRTVDTVPPVILAFSALYQPPSNMYTITIATSKPGTLYYLGINPGESAPVMPVNLLLPSYGNFSGSASLPEAYTNTSVTLCVADGQILHLYGLVQDEEGTLPPRHIPNNSTIVKASLQLLSPMTSRTCPAASFLSALRFTPSLSSAMAGFPIGPLIPTFNNETLGSNVVSWSQSFGAFMMQPSGGSSDSRVVLSAGTVPLDSFSFMTSGSQPAFAKALLRTPTLYAEDNDSAGQSLGLAIQLFDSQSRTWVSTQGLSALPILSLPPSMGSSSQGSSSQVVLPSCSLSSSLPVGSGVGNCFGAVPLSSFPGAGSSATANVTLKVYIGSNLVTISDPIPLILLGAPIHPVLNPPTSAPGLLMTLPYRPIHEGEVFKVTLTAVVSGNTPMWGFNVPLTFDSTRVLYISSRSSVLWSQLFVSMVPIGDSTTSLYLTCTTALGSSSMYIGPSVTLVDVYFSLIASDLTGQVPVVAIANGATLYPFQNVTIQVNDVRSGLQTDGSGYIMAAPTENVGMLAWSQNYDLLNTAVFNNVNVASPISAVVITSYPISLSSILMTPVTPDVCVVESTAPGSGSSSSTSAFDLSKTGCTVLVMATHSAAVKGAVIAAHVSSLSLVANVSIQVWFPKDFNLTSDDTMLNRILPLNAAPIPAGCVGIYQTSALHLYVTWSNGGGSEADSVNNVDVTADCTFTSQVPSRVQVLGTSIRGLGSMDLVNVTLSSYNALAQASILVNVSDKAVCMMGMTTLAVTGFNFTVQSSTLNSSTIDLQQTLTLGMIPQQELTWIGDTANVRTLVTYSDGNVADVTDMSKISARTLSVPNLFYLGTNSTYNSPQLYLNASVGDPTICGPGLTSTWSLCSSIPMASSNGTVSINIPNPLAISVLNVAPWIAIPGEAASLVSHPRRGSLTVIPGEAASLSPINVPTSTPLSALVSFSDGSVHDFTQSSSTVFTVTSGSGLCQIIEGSSGVPTLVTQSSAVSSGICTLEAQISFPRFQTLLQYNQTKVIVVSQLNLYNLAPNASAAPNTNTTLAPSPVIPSYPIRFLQCDWSNYETRTIWVLAQLSNCSVAATLPGGSGCILYDLNGDIASSAVHLSLAMNSVASLVVNPLLPQGSPSNLIVPNQAGTTTLTATFAELSTVVTLSVEETFLPGWPKVVKIENTSFVVLANMSAAYTLTGLVVTSNQLTVLDTDFPSAASVEVIGTPLMNASSLYEGGFIYSLDVTGLTPATNYSVLLTVRSSDILVSTVIVITGVLTPNTIAPTFTSLGPLQNLMSGTQTFTASVPVTVDKASTVSFAMYWNTPCISGQPTENEVLTGGSLSSATCNCTPSTLCAPVDTGVSSVVAGKLNYTLSLQAPLPTNPYSFLNGATQSQLTCVAINVTQFASMQLSMYIVAQDQLPNYKGWDVNCSAPVNTSSTIGSCTAAAYAPCSDSAPANQVTNVQLLPYHVSNITNMSVSVPWEQAAVVPISLQDNMLLVFNNKTTAVSSNGLTVTFSFQTNRAALVYYRLVINVNVILFYGAFPIYDPSSVYNVTVQRSCSGDALSVASYGFWYWASDIYGRQTDLVITPVTLQG